MIPSTIRLRPHVADDVLDIVRSIGGDSPDAADRFVEQLPIVLRQIAAMPGMGSPKPFRDKRLADVRSWRVKGFPKQLILYRPTADGIEVLAIVHGARNLPRLLRDRDAGD